MDDIMQKIVSLCKRRGFVYPGSEIYGGLANTWDFGPLGVQLKKNVKDLWWKRFVESRSDIVGIDSGILMNPRVWEASGHVTGFNDVLVECKKCHKRFRGDHLIEEYTGKDFQQCFSEFIEQQESGFQDKQHIDTLIKLRQGEPVQQRDDETGEEKTDEPSKGLQEAAKVFLGGRYSRDPLYAIDCMLQNYKIKCPNCDEEEWGNSRTFNLMFKTHIGPVEDKGSEVYLRPETAQGMFVNFKNILDSTRVQLPFGIAQIGKAFRNEITPGNFIFRVLEFEQMEIEYFIRQGEWQKTFEKWQNEMSEWLAFIGIKKENYAIREHDASELCHYSKRTVDFEYRFPFGTKELYGLAYRTDFDLTNHAKHSGVDLFYTDPDTGEKFIPHVIEPTFGVERTALAILCDAYTEEKERVVLRLNPKIAPIKIAVFPLLRNKPELVAKAREIFTALSPHFACDFDDNGNVGKRYRRQDEIGTPYCVTVDFDTIEDETVTVRERDTMRQERVSVTELNHYFAINLH